MYRLFFSVSCFCVLTLPGLVSASPVSAGDWVGGSHAGDSLGFHDSAHHEGPGLDGLQSPGVRSIPVGTRGAVPFGLDLGGGSGSPSARGGAVDPACGSRSRTIRATRDLAGRARWLIDEPLRPS
ncbi:MAG: hypothetical protein AAGM22_24180 [Acidobacteriota bacterium]